MEIDHLKTTVVSLDTKVKVLDDMKEDRDNARDQLNQSEQKREELHTHIKDTVVKIEKDTEEHKTYQDSLISDNQDQREEIKRLNELLAAKEKEYLQNMESVETDRNDTRARLEREKNTEVERLTKENYETMSRLEKEKNDGLD